MQKEMETWRKAREVGEREERSYTDTAAGLPTPKVAVEVRALTCVADLHTRMRCAVLVQCNGREGRAQALLTCHYARRAPL